MLVHLLSVHSPSVSAGPVIANKENTALFNLICVANVSIWFRSKKRPRNGIFGFGHVRNGTSHFSRGLWLSFLVFWSETARKWLLRTLFSIDSPISFMLWSGFSANYLQKKIQKVHVPAPHPRQKTVQIFGSSCATTPNTNLKRRST